MKKIMSIVLAITFLISFTVVNAAATTTNTTARMSMDGKMVDFKVVQLSINNQLIQSDVPPVIHNERTLVPLRIITENMNAEILWNQATQEVTVKTVDQTIVLKINSSVAKVNGNDVNLPDNVPAKLIDGRTMVPIRFVANTLGLLVDWNAQTQTVLLTYTPPAPKAKVTAINVNANGSYPEIRVKTSQEVEYKESRIDSHRIIFDLQNVQFALEDKRFLLADGTYRMPLSNGPVKEIRGGQKNQPLSTQIVLQLEKDMKHQTRYDEKTGEIVISFANHVDNVSVQQLNMKEVVIIEGGNVANFNTLSLDQPNRFVIDVMDAELSGHQYTLNIDGRVAKNVRVAQFDPRQLYKPDDKVVRVTIDLQDLENYEEFYVESKGNQLIVHLEGKPASQLNYVAHSWTTSRLTFKGNAVTQYQVRRLPNTSTVEVLVPKNAINFDFVNQIVNDQLIKNITIDNNDSNSNYRVLIEMEKEVEHRVISPSLTTRDLVLEFKHTNKYREVLVIIDPGHGGSDPGAMNGSQRESGIVLDVSLRLNKLLVDAGFRTYMTRTGDTFLNLRERVEVANQLNGDVFISVHANAATNKSAHGIENYYFPTVNHPTDTRNNKRLAEILQNSMIKELGAHNRGAKPNTTFVVTRETKMPAVLSEIGFLSNQAEAALLASPEYRQRIAVSMFNAIVSYFEETKFK